MSESSFPWVPYGTSISAGVSTGRLLAGSEWWQVLETNRLDEVLLLLREVDDGHLSRTSELRLLQEHLELSPLAFGDEKFRFVRIERDLVPVRLGSFELRVVPAVGEELDALGPAIAALLVREPDSDLEEALFIPSVSLCLGGVSRKQESAVVDLYGLAQRIVTGGVRSPRMSARQMSVLNRWAEEKQVESFLAELGLLKSASAGPRPEPLKAAADFVLPGRPRLQEVFRSEVIDYWARPARYQAMGVKPPAGILLHGPPGSGKSFAAEKLAEHLGWPVFRAESRSIGSALAHESPRRIASLFDAAGESAPALVLLEEVDAWGGERELRSAAYRVEEVATLLQCMDHAADRGILVVATSNRIEAVDPALLRTGRFDQVVEVQMPSKGEMVEVLSTLLESRPTASGLSVEGAATRLAGRSMSDLRWVVDRAARVAIRQNKEVIDEFALHEAVKLLLGRGSR
ncbi:MAG: hypothetical protein AMXMBFR36_15080 [Acidobacteriota bacterium]